MSSLPPLEHGGPRAPSSSDPKYDVPTVLLTSARNGAPREVLRPQAPVLSDGCPPRLLP
jgi:hypothetical protein